MSKRFYFTAFLLFLILILPPLSAQVPVKLSAGASMGGTGLAGIPVQLKFGKFAAIDAGAYFRTAHVGEFEERWYFGPAFDAGINIFLINRENQDKNKASSHGIFLKGAYGLNKRAKEDYIRLSERSASAGWILEINNKANPHRFFQIQLGPSVIQHSENFLNTRYPPGEQLQSSELLMPMIYFRLTWFLSIDAGTS